MIKVALIHGQLETIHAFLDGNGRIGRPLIAALVEHFGLLPEPLMYLSGYLKHTRSSIADDYRHSFRGGRGIVDKFLSGRRCHCYWRRGKNIIEVASLVTTDRRRLLQAAKAGPAGGRLFEMRPMMPLLTIERVRQQLNTSFPSATAAVKTLEDLGIVAERAGQNKNRSYSYQVHVNLLTRGFAKYPWPEEKHSNMCCCSLCPRRRHTEVG
jgi:hypothetical protein